MSGWKKLAAASAAGGDSLDVDDVFSTYLYEGSGNPRGISNGIALADGVGGGTSTQFDGSSDALQKSSDLSGNSDGKTFTFSFWIYPTPANNNSMRVYHTSGTWRNEIRWGTDGALFVAFYANESSGGTVFEMQNPNIKCPAYVWSHVVFSADMANTSNRYLYINDQQATPSWGYSNSNIDFTRSTHAIADDLTASTGSFKGNIAHFYYDRTYRDLSVTSTRRNFINADGGSTPPSTLSALNPLLYLPMTEDYSIGESLGTGGDFTAIGSPTIVNNGTESLSGVGQGGLVWTKPRDLALGHILYDSERSGKLSTNEATSEGTDSFSFSMNSSGYSFNTGSSAFNQNGNYYVSWTFRKAPKFFDIVTWTGNGVNGRSISHSLDSLVGMITVKCTSTSSTNWSTWHRGASGTLWLNSTNPDSANGGGQATSGFVYNPGSNTSAFTVDNGANVNQSGRTYVAYLFAHNNGDGEFGPDADQDIIKCGSFTDNGSLTTVNLGFEPQWLLVKTINRAGVWAMLDNMRGIPTNQYVSTPLLFSNDTAAESYPYRAATSDTTGFTWKTGQTSVTNDTLIYVAIRARDGNVVAEPETATDAFDVSVSSGSTGTEVSTGFPIDMQIQSKRSTPLSVVLLRKENLISITGTAAANGGLTMRYLQTASTYPSLSNEEGQFGQLYNNTGFSIGSSYSGASTAYYSFKRARGFLDVVSYNGNGVAGHTVSHNLGVEPEMIIVKDYNDFGNWIVGLQFGASTFNYGFLNSTQYISGSGYSNTTEFFAQPTSTSFSLGTSVETNNSIGKYLAYLFASVSGVSKVGSYTGNGTSQTIDCGFTSGARFILIKRITSSGNWYVWDTERGIVAGNDPHLSLNTTAAEVTSDDSIDPANSGFIVNQVSATNINVSSSTYIFYAIA